LDEEANRSLLNLQLHKRKVQHFEQSFHAKVQKNRTPPNALSDSHFDGIETGRWHASAIVNAIIQC
jgi:hypothetical protein